VRPGPPRASGRLPRAHGSLRSLFVRPRDSHYVRVSHRSHRASLATDHSGRAGWSGCALGASGPERSRNRPKHAV